MDIDQDQDYGFSDVDWDAVAQYADGAVNDDNDNQAS